MSEFNHAERPSLLILAEPGWEVMDPKCGRIPSNPEASIRARVRQPAVGLLKANEVAHGLLHKTQVDRNERTGEAGPSVLLIGCDPCLGNVLT